MEKRSSKSKRKNERGPREGVEGSRAQRPVHARLIMCPRTGAS